MSILHKAVFAGLVVLSGSALAGRPSPPPSEPEAAEADGTPVKLDNLRAGFLFHRLSKMPVKLEDFAVAFPEVGQASDEFERRDVLAKVKPDLEDAQRSVATAKSFLIAIRSKLGDYDFDRKGFPTGISETTFVPFDVGAFGADPHYAVSLKNGAEYSLLQMEEGEARKFAAVMRKCCTYREVTLEVVVTPISAEKTTLDSSMKKRGNINAKILRMRVLYDGRQVAMLP